MMEQLNDAYSKCRNYFLVVVISVEAQRVECSIPSIIASVWENRFNFSNRRASKIRKSLTLRVVKNNMHRTPSVK